MVAIDNPQFLLFAQHGWADTGASISKLAQVADPQAKIIAPNLGFINTFIRIDFLVDRLEQIAKEAIEHYSNIPIKIVGHSMGGSIWLELLTRNPQWWHRVHSFILLGSPVGGSNIARAIDPLGIGIGTAGDLGKNRRSLAEQIAREIPTLSVASDTGMGTDGLVTVENTKFDYANWLLVHDIPHSAMRYHPDMVSILREFWANPQLCSPPPADLSNRLIRHLRSVAGITDADYRNFKRSQIVASLAEDLTLHTWNNPFGVSHVYLGKQERCLYAGYVGMLHGSNLRRAIREISNSIV